MHALYKWQHYVLGCEFDIWSDHKNLSWFMTEQNLNQRQACWAAELTNFNFLLHYRKGSTMGISDGLSRHPDLKGEVEQDNTDQIVLLVHQFADLYALSTGTLIHLQGDIIVEQICHSMDEYNRKVVTALNEAF